MMVKLSSSRSLHHSLELSLLMLFLMLALLLTMGVKKPKKNKNFEMRPERYLESLTSKYLARV